MRIQTIQGAPLGAPARARRRQAAFALPPADDGEATPAAGQAAPALAAREVPGPDAPSDPPQASMSDREAARHGQAVLEALARVQLASLGQGAGPDALAGLDTGSLRAADPGLDLVLRAIGARAAVVLARSG